MANDAKTIPSKLSIINNNEFDIKGLVIDPTQQNNWIIRWRSCDNNAISLHKSTCDNAKITPIEYRLLNNRQSLNPLIHFPLILSLIKQSKTAQYI